MYQGEYKLIGIEMSLFTRKLEAQLRFQQVPWRWHFKTQERTPEIEARSGTHFIPLLETPDNWLIHDTIAIGPMLNQRYPEHPVVPETPLQRASAFILEDFFNHWLGRSSVHSRWCYPDNVKWVGLRMASNGVLGRHIDEPLSPEEQKQFEGIGQMMYEGFGKNVCDYNGVPVEQSEAVQADFRDMLGVLAEHFRHNDFLLGPRPCIADFALAGASKAHYITDPEPKSWLKEHEKMLTEYTATGWGMTRCRRASVSCSTMSNAATWSWLPPTLLAARPARSSMSLILATDRPGLTHRAGSTRHDCTYRMNSRG
jgi:glutathione S-transferase